MSFTYKSPLLISRKGLQLIMEFEGFVPSFYKPNGEKKSFRLMTIGYGHTDTPFDVGITEEQAYTLLLSDLVYYANHIHRVLGDLWYKATQSQRDAILSFTYNVGVGHFSSSTLCRTIIQQGFDYVTRDMFTRFSRSVGRQLAGLVRRRNAEYDMYVLGY